MKTTISFLSAFPLYLCLLISASCATPGVQVSFNVRESPADRVAIMPFEMDAFEAMHGQDMPPVFERLLLKLGYDVISDLQLREALREKNYQGVPGTRTAIETARLAGAAYVITGTSHWFGAHRNITARMTNVETGTLIWSLRAEGADEAALLEELKNGLAADPPG